MKVITEQSYQSIVDTIIREEERLAEKASIPFSGISHIKLEGKVRERIGDDWTIRRDPKVKFSKSDINAVANSRFYKLMGLKLLLGLAVAILVVAAIVNYVEGFPMWVAWVLYAIEALTFVYIYSKGQAKIRRQLWHELGRNENDEV